VILTIAQGWSSEAIHRTVAEVIRARGYRRSLVGSLLGRLLFAVLNALDWLRRGVQRIPGGRVTVITIIAAIVLLIVGRIMLTAEWRDEGLIRRRDHSRRPLRSDPWSEAERLAANGEYTAAAHALYQAVLRRLAGAERIRVHSSKTSGDYWRELRRRGSPAAAPFRLFGRRFDRVIFGVRECSRDEFEAMLREANAVADTQAA
jgi:hypothetical protein